jgi:hypothetical protein
MRLRPAGRPSKYGHTIKVDLSDYDKRRVDQLCQIMRVDYSEFFRLILAGALEMAKESNERQVRPLEVVQ